MLLRMRSGSRRISSGFLPLPQGWARRDVGNGSACLTNPSKRSKCEKENLDHESVQSASSSILFSQLGADVLESPTSKGPSKSYRRRRRLDDAFDAIIRHAGYGEKSICEGELSQIEHSYRPWRSTRPPPNAESSVNISKHNKSDFIQYRSELTDQNVESTQEKEGHFWQDLKKSTDLCSFKDWRHTPFLKQRPTADPGRAIRGHPMCCLSTYPPEYETRRPTPSWVHTELYDSNHLDPRHFPCHFESANNTEEIFFCEEYRNAPRIQSCRSPKGKCNFPIMPTISPPDSEYRNRVKNDDSSVAPHCCSTEGVFRTIPSRSTSDVLRALPPRYLLSEDQGREIQLAVSSQSSKRSTRCPSMGHTFDSIRKIDGIQVHEGNLMSFCEQEHDHQSDRPVSTDSLFEVLTEDWVPSLVQKHSTPSQELLQSEKPHKKEHSTSKSTLSTSNYQRTEELQKEFLQDMQSACPQLIPAPRVNSTNKAIQTSPAEFAKNVEVQVLLSTGLSTACPRCGYFSNYKETSQATLYSRLPMTKLNSSLKSPHTILPLEQTTNIYNDTATSANNSVSIELPQPANLSNERTPRRCIVQEGGTTDGVYNVYSVPHSIFLNYPVPKQHAASAKTERHAKSANISSSSYDYAVED
ncbi:hypothetical protein SprV_0200749700 [Sparganum proliferum]